MARFYERVFQIYDYVEEFTGRKGQSPSIKEIGLELDITVSCVSRHLRTMERLGMIHRPTQKSIELVTRKPNWNRLLPEIVGEIE